MLVHADTTANKSKIRSSCPKGALSTGFGKDTSESEVEMVWVSHTCLRQGRQEGRVRHRRPAGTPRSEDHDPVV